MLIRLLCSPKGMLAAAMVAVGSFATLLALVPTFQPIALQTSAVHCGVKVLGLPKPLSSWGCLCVALYASWYSLESIGAEDQSLRRAGCTLAMGFILDKILQTPHALLLLFLQYREQPALVPAGRRSASRHR